jgi:DNA-binding IscR family transcriptional regulator
VGLNDLPRMVHRSTEIWQELQNAINQVVDNVTIAYLVKEKAE